MPSVHKMIKHTLKILSHTLKNACLFPYSARKWGYTDHTKAYYLKTSMLRSVFPYKMTSIYFLRPSKVWTMLQHGSVWLILTNYCYSIVLCTFLEFFCCFSRHRICVFIIFISFSDKVSNFRNRILTNQKRELVVSNCQWNCMLVSTKWSNLRKKS